MAHTLRAHGKLLLTGEYFVLDGALALAVPTRYGQTLDYIRDMDRPDMLRWVSRDERGEAWFTAHWEWQGETLTLQSTTDEAAAGRLVQLFKAAFAQHPAARSRLQGAEVTTRLDFPRDWGLGTSSTLVSLLSRWLEVNPYELLAASFGGSGYDIACATAEGPLLYLRRPALPTEPLVTERDDWYPPCARSLFFVHLGQKQNSRTGIARYRSRGGVKKADLEHINHLTFDLLEAEDEAAFGDALREHESVISRAIGLRPVQEERFPDFPGAIKSLGAWGGDFVLALSPWPPKRTRAYFAERGCPTVIHYDQMVL
jgi:mevalonate kinase